MRRNEWSGRNDELCSLFNDNWSWSLDDSGSNSLNNDWLWCWLFDNWVDNIMRLRVDIVRDDWESGFDLSSPNIIAENIVLSDFFDVTGLVSWSLVDPISNFLWLDINGSSRRLESRGDIDGSNLRRLGLVSGGRSIVVDSSFLVHVELAGRGTSGSMLFRGLSWDVVGIE